MMKSQILSEIGQVKNKVNSNHPLLVTIIILLYIFIFHQLYVYNFLSNQASLCLLPRNDLPEHLSVGITLILLTMPEHLSVCIALI